MRCNNNDKIANLTFNVMSAVNYQNHSMPSYIVCVKTLANVSVTLQTCLELYFTYFKFDLFILRSKAITHFGVFTYYYPRLTETLVLL